MMKIEEHLEVERRAVKLFELFFDIARKAFWDLGKREIDLRVPPRFLRMTDLICIPLSTAHFQLATCPGGGPTPKLGQPLLNNR